jgi:hypothetical protein
VLNLHNLSIETIRRVEPLFKELYQSALEKEIEFLEGVLGKCIQNGEIIPCDTRRIAKSILTVADALKHSACDTTDLRLASEIDYSKIEDDIIFTVSLILEGIKK